MCSIAASSSERGGRYSRHRLRRIATNCRPAIREQPTFMKSAAHPGTCREETTLKTKPAVTTTILAIAFALSTTAANAAELERVTISTSIDTLDAMLPQLGEHLGIMEKQGLNLSFIRGANGPAMISAVVGGSADITHVSTALYFPAMEKGASFTFLSGNYDIDYTFIGQKGLDWPHQSEGYPALVQDLKGRRVGIAGRGGATERMVRKMLADAGLDPENDVTYVAVGTGVGAAGAFDNDQVDAMVIIPPTDLLIPAEKINTLLDISMTQQKVYSPDYLFTVFAANSDFVKNRPEVAAAFCEGVSETLTYARDPAHQDEIVSYLSAAMNLEPEQAATLWSGYSANFNLKLTEERWNAMGAFTDYVPDWQSSVFQPCIDIANAN